MYLIVEELLTSLEQTVVVSERTEIESIRPYIYLHGAPAGSLKLSIISGSTTLSSKTMTVAALISAAAITQTYAHGFVRFQLDDTVFIPAGTYIVKLEGVGYTFGATWAGWVKEYENLTNTPTTTITNDLDQPLSMQIWSY